MVSHGMQPISQMFTILRKVVLDKIFIQEVHVEEFVMGKQVYHQQKC